LNLTEADYIYLVDPWWNPAVENQAIDRAHRIGQDKKVMAVRLICPGTVEDKIIKLQESKKQLMGDLVKTDTSFLSSLSKEDLLGLFQ
ncbi:MAG TPA: helicase-related protein, partial [Chitinophagaceae bacterium]|nr:helicase-related protein [Chitinophagaceae bacterium]